MIPVVQGGDSTAARDAVPAESRAIVGQAQLHFFDEAAFWSSRHLGIFGSIFGKFGLRFLGNLVYDLH